MDGSPVHISPEIQEELRCLEESVINTLKRASEYGNVVIITNAEQGWVELSAGRFLPKVVPLLSYVRIVSARTTYEPMYPNSPLDWKIAAFSQEVQNNFEVFSASGEMRSLVSFGDSIHERDAVHRVASMMESTHTKSIKFVERPSVEQLRRQVELVHNCFDYICNYSGDLDLMLTIQLLANGGVAAPGAATTGANP